MRVAI